MRPDKITVPPARTPRQALEHTLSTLEGPDPYDQPFALAALFAERSTVPLDETNARREVLARALAAGHVHLTEDSFALTRDGYRSLPTHLRGAPAYQRHLTVWRGDHLFPHARQRRLEGSRLAWKAPAYPGVAHTVAAHASSSADAVGIAAVGSDGRWGACSYRHEWVLGAHEPPATSALRAVAMAVSLLDPVDGGTALTSCPDAHATLHKWGQGMTRTPAPDLAPHRVKAQELFPGGLSLEELRRTVLYADEVDFQGAAHGPELHLAEAAEAVAMMVRRAASTSRPTAHHVTGEPLGDRAHALAARARDSYRAAS